MGNTNLTSLLETSKKLTELPTEKSLKPVGNEHVGKNKIEY